MMTVTYPVKKGIYVNMTNRCPCACTFCLRQNGDSVYGSEPLWLDREPTVEEVCASIDRWDLAQYEEVVFCGYGEPTERLDDLLKVAAYIREKSNIRIRINTNGQANMIEKRDVTPEFKDIIDSVSISLNAPNAKRYDEICKSHFGEAAFDGLQEFARLAKRYVPKVTLSIVDHDLTPEEIETCRSIAEKCGVDFRVRAYIE